MVKREDGRWQERVSVVVSGKKVVKYFYGKSKTEVTRKIAEWQKEIPAIRSISFRELAEQWRDWSEGQLSPTTYKGYTPAYKRAINQFGDMDASAIKTSDISKYMLSFRAEHTGAKVNQTQLTVITRIMQYGVNRGIIEQNPANGIEPPKGQKTKRHMPSSEDLARIKAAPLCDCKVMAYLALYAGLRLGEILALTPEDIDRAAGVISVSKSVYRGLYGSGIKEPKTEAGRRVVPIPDQLAAILPAEWIPRSLSEKGHQKAWGRFCRDNGINCTIHQLRHAYATMLIEAGIQPVDAQGLLGHAQLATTVDVYRDIREHRQKEIREKLRGIDIA